MICYVPEFILVDYLIGDVLDADANVFRSFEGGHEVKILYVHGHELGVSCGDYTFEKERCYQHICCGRCYFTGIVDSISSNN